eukprot:gene14353-biopygen3170
MWATAHCVRPTTWDVSSAPAGIYIGSEAGLGPAISDQLDPAGPDWYGPGWPIRSLDPSWPSSRARVCPHSINESPPLLTEGAGRREGAAHACSLCVASACERLQRILVSSKAGCTLACLAGAGGRVHIQGSRGFPESSLRVAAGFPGDPHRSAAASPQHPRGFPGGSPRGRRQVAAWLP